MQSPVYEEYLQARLKGNQSIRILIPIHWFEGLPWPYCLSMLISESMLGLSIEWQLNKSPRAAKKSLPRKGKPGRLAKTNIRKSGCMAMYLSLVAEARNGLVEGTILRPSDKIISPDSTRFFRIQVTWVGALSASSTTNTCPDLTALTRALSS